MANAGSVVLVLGALVAGCATAGQPNNVPGTDAPVHPDAGPDAARDDAAHADAAHADTPRQIDAPAGGCAMPFTGALATWDFTSGSGMQASTAAASSAPGITASAVSRASGLTAVSGAMSINASNWPTGGLDASKYYTLSVTPPSGCTLDITKLAIDAKASSSGPASGSVATSADNFTLKVSASTSTPSTPNVTVHAATGAVEIRIYGYAAGSASGTLRVESTLTVTGSLQ